MIACACIKSSSPSSSKKPILKTPKKLKPCKSCQGKVLVDDQTSPQISMVSNNRSFQLSKSIDPQLKWKNSRQRAVRKPRTSIVWSTTKFSDNLNNDSMSLEEDMPIAESEKVGVSILGRRFRGTSGNAPPKKRKISLHHSLSSPHCSSSNSDDLSHAVLKREPDPCIADFSGISILAAVACDSYLGLTSSDFQGPLKENADLILSPNKNVLPTPQFSVADLPSDASCLSALHSERSTNEVKSNDSMKSSQNVSCKIMEITSNKVIPILDLNAATDESLEHENIYSGSKNMDHDGTDENSEPLMNQLNCGVPKDLPSESKTVESEEIKTCDIEGCKAQLVTEDTNVSGTAKNLVLTSETEREEEKAEASSIPLQLKVDTENPSSHLDSCEHVLTDSRSATSDGLIAAKGSSCTDQELFSSHSSSHLEESDTLNKNSSDKITGGMNSVANSPKTVTSNSHHGNPQQNDLGEGHNNGDEQANGMEKLQCLSDDDSQYEDGELREPLTNSWFDGAEEDDTDIVDYGSDRDETTHKATPELPSDASITRNDILENSDSGKKLHSPNCYRSISSWDRLPGRCKNSYNKGIKYRDHDHHPNPSRSTRPYNSTDRAKPSFCRGLTRISHSNDSFKGRRSRSRSIERNGFNPRVERQRESPQPIQRNMPYILSQDNDRNDSSTYCHPRNAVVEKIANIERNGFIVAPDGTIVKAKASSYPFGRGSPTDRGRNYNTALKNYRISSPDRYSNGVDKNHLNFRRYNNVASPPRSHFHMSRSPPRPRIHSPQRWISPRGRNELTSDFGDGPINHGSLSRNYASHFREHRVERYDSVSYDGRGRRGGFSRPVNSGRFHEIHRKNDDDIRERQYMRNGYVKRPWYDDEDGFLGENTRQKSYGFQRRDGPRVFNKGFTS